MHQCDGFDIQYLHTIKEVQILYDLSGILLVVVFNTQQQLYTVVN